LGEPEGHHKPQKKGDFRIRPPFAGYRKAAQFRLCTGSTQRRSQNFNAEFL